MQILFDVKEMGYSVAIWQMMSFLITVGELGYFTLRLLPKT